MPEKEITVISLGGSLIAPKTGFNIPFLKSFKQIIVKFLEDNHRFIIVCGGGNTARLYQAAALEVGELTAEDIDWIGIHATRLNAHFMRTVFRKWAHPVVVKDPTRKLKWTEEILIGAGWQPGWSTDYDAVKMAELYGAKVVVNLSNIEYVYSADPRKNPQAKRLEKIGWREFRKIVGNKWIPGANLPFDPIASREAEKMKLKVMVMSGNDLANVSQAIKGDNFKGTTIS